MRGLYAVKPWFVTRLRRAEDLFAARRIAPDTITAAGVVAAVAAGTATALGGILGLRWLWLLVPPLAVARLACNALDGAVARRTGRARPAGIVVNEMADRVADAAMLGGVAFVAPPALALGALAVAFLTATTGVVVLAATGERATSGPMGKADRVGVLALAAAVAPWVGGGAFTAALWIVIAGGMATVALRTAGARRALEEAGRV